MKRLLACGDTHCGHVFGWAPPDRWVSRKLFPAIYRLQKACYEFTVKTIEKLKPIDVMLLNGDAGDGKGARSGGRELYTSDRMEQMEIALELVALANPTVLVLTHGTTYHTGDEELFERMLAVMGERQRIPRVEVHHYVQFSLGGVTFGARHHIGSSSVAHGRQTALARERVWQALWEDAERRDPVDVTLRSHVHYYQQQSDSRGFGMILPCLQIRSEYGASRCSGLFDYGLVHFDCENGSVRAWEPHLLACDTERVRTTNLDRYL